MDSEEDEIPSIVLSPGGQQGRDPGKQLANPRKLLWHNIAGYVQDVHAKTPTDAYGQAGVGTI